MFSPFVWGPQNFSKHLQLTELSSKLAESALLIKLQHKEMEVKVSMSVTDNDPDVISSIIKHNVESIGNN